MKVVTIFIRCFLYIILCTLSKADVKTQRYTMDTSLDNKVSNVSLMAIHHSESLTGCSAMCGGLCAFFGFNPQLKICRIHQSCDPSAMTINETGWRNFFPDGCNNVLKTSCMEILQSDPTVKGKDGVYSISVTDKKKTVYCDMTTDGGGWTVIQKRQDNSTDFYRTWAEYKEGFGDPSKNYWIGNDAIHYLTKTNQELRVELLSFDDEKAYALYSTFQVGNESSKYRLTVSGYNGTAGDSLMNHIGQEFSTQDQDNDEWSSGNCAVDWHGAWWYSACAYTNLNGQYRESAVSCVQCPYWVDWKSQTALKGTVMQIRPKN
ncbi:fibrinogen C domain-containing protein 1-A-like [Ostrea edulis]|uniref:fibrinogen C domain-containing protein 1-A-like n=1 Tax=Ostrea edulis TaxID=37623 RepID=UPI0024AE9F34|nr:fibrinogen C domain-containing protein 1-A-like [Ostrea edulis]